MRVDIAYHTVNGHTFWTNEEYPDNAVLSVILDDKRQELLAAYDFIRVPNGAKIADVKATSIDAISVSKAKRV